MNLKASRVSKQMETESDERAINLRDFTDSIQSCDIESERIYDSDEFESDDGDGEIDEVEDEDEDAPRHTLQDLAQQLIDQKSGLICFLILFITLKTLMHLRMS